ncbi:hypothetical protein BLEM_0626 [Bifidobacterium lemurum]|uniref:HdeD family acid-resistance protein n=1 Tax=Bifidobacterium lemurum TaxID=1603886 RepID=A0A261FU53_9BIFI|nr:HdeD family acid-resistance protein [Bifidobacterium lemurum]OZG62709.1 hypothetical protein BLEM_0626 [Bifidobacterium lemurum]QOL34574.1 HdeD family acid-resistance protein [Bifidobacterium lemurum]
MTENNPYANPDPNGGSQQPQYGAYAPQGQNQGNGQQYYGPYADNPNGQQNPYGNGQQNPYDNGPQWQPGWQPQFNPFKLIEENLPHRAVTLIRTIYGVAGIAAIIIGVALLLVPGKTLALLAVALGVYFIVSGLVRVVTALVEPGLPGGWRVLDVIVGALLALGGAMVVKNSVLTGQTLALMITLFVGFGWILEGVMSLVESWRLPRSGWAVLYAIVSIIAGMIVLFSPLSATAWLMIFGACALVVIGISAIIRAFTFGRRAK